MKAKKQPEAKIQDAVYAYLSMCDEWFGFAVYNGGIYDPRIRAYRANKGAGKRNGVSDLVGCWKAQLFCIETKTPKGVLSADQKKFRDDVIKAGALYVCVRSMDDIISWVAAMRFISLKTMIEIGSESEC